MANLLSTFSTLQRRNGTAEAMHVARPVAAANVPTDVVTTLREMQLLAHGDTPRLFALPSSRTARVYRVDLGWGTVCLKQALGLGDVVVDTFTSARAAAEVGWFKLACNVVPGAAPVVLASQTERAAFATDYLDPSDFPCWERQLSYGEIDPGVATELGHLIGRLHAASAHSIALEERFSMQTAFHALRLEPIFQRIAVTSPSRCGHIAEIAEGLTRTRVALVHASVTPDNVLVGPRGVILIDADCAHYGDPMFDVATCIAALAVRMVEHHDLREALGVCLDAFRHSYFTHLTWEIADNAEARAARMIPALIAGALADLERPTALSEQAGVAVRMMLADPPARIVHFLHAWQRVFEGQQ
jgi:Phosphotransferase enzyme family